MGTENQGGTVIFEIIHHLFYIHPVLPCCGFVKENKFGIYGKYRGNGCPEPLPPAQGLGKVLLRFRIDMASREVLALSSIFLYFN